MNRPFLPPHHSVLAADALASQLTDRYALGDEVHVTLWVRGMNDVYLVRTGQERCALRVYRANWHSAADIDDEIAFLRHLADRGFPVAAPIAGRDGHFRFRVSAFEGVRDAVLFSWIEGRELREQPTPTLGGIAGTWIARIHCLPPFRDGTRRQTDYVGLLSRELPAFLDLISDATTRAWCSSAANTLLDRLRAALLMLPRGAVHGDCHAGNFFVRPSGDLAILDFDNSGEGAFVEDLACLRWSAQFRNLPQAFITAFRGGYEQIRPLTPNETAAIPLFVAARQQWWFGGVAANANAIGAGLLLGGGLAAQIERFKRYLAAADIAV